MLSPDTDRESRAVQVAVFRGMTPGERLVAALAMSEEVRLIAEAGAAWRARTGGSTPPA